jgi:hypothetical protein
MKSPIYFLVAALPLVSQVALANPVADDGNIDLEERTNDPCKVKNDFWHWSWPCKWGHKTGQTKKNDHFDPYCYYE